MEMTMRSCQTTDEVQCRPMDAGTVAPAGRGMREGSCKPVTALNEINQELARNSIILDAGQPQIGRGTHFVDESIFA